MDFVKWAQPEQGQSGMVEQVKNHIETVGFHQMVLDITRTWLGQPDLILDHCWMNSPEKLIFQRNLNRSFSDKKIYFGVL